jgi:hypothetical protein
LSPDRKKKPKSGKKKGKSGKTWDDLTMLSDRSGRKGNPPPKAITLKKNKPKLNKSMVQVIKAKPIPEKPQLCFGKTVL